MRASVHRNLGTYAEVLSCKTGQKASSEKIVAPMLAQFMAVDRSFAKRQKYQTKAPVKEAGKPTPPSPRSQPYD